VTPSPGPMQSVIPAGLRALGAALLGAGIWIGLAGPFQLTWGLLAVAVFVGWLVGSAARSATPTPDRRVRLVAGAGGLLAWIASLVGVYVYLSALPPGPAQSGHLVGSLSLVDYYAQNLSLLDVIEGLLAAAAAWWSAR
jgi:hypothetical protein